MRGGRGISEGVVPLVGEWGKGWSGGRTFWLLGGYPVVAIRLPPVPVDLPADR